MTARASEEEIMPWDHDHTSLVHVLWKADRDGLDLKRDADELASRIMSSKWMRAVRTVTVETQAVAGVHKETTYGTCTRSTGVLDGDGCTGPNADAGQVVARATVMEDEEYGTDHGALRS